MNRDKVWLIMRLIAMWLIILALFIMSVVWIFGSILLLADHGACPLSPCEIWFGVSFYSLPLGLGFAWALKKIGFIADLKEAFKRRNKAD